MWRDGKVIGIAGTGLDITEFVHAFVNTDEPGLSSFILDKDGGIVASRDLKQMNMRILLMDKNEKNTIYSLVDEASEKAFRSQMKTLEEKPASLLVTYQGRPHIAALAKAGETGWITLTLVDTTDAVETGEIFFYLAMLLGALLIAVAVMALLMDRGILHPLKSLSEGALDIAHGNYTIRFKAIKKDEIGQVQHSFNEMAAQVQAYTTELETKVAQRTEALQERNRKITTLLNSSQEGFLSFGPDGIVEPEYSKECETIFGGPIAGKAVAELLYPGNGYRQEGLNRMFESAWTQKSPYLQEVILSLFPKEFQLGDRFLESRFGMEDGKMVLILKDVTQAKALQAELDREKQVLQMVVEFVKDDAVIRDLIGAFRTFCEEAPRKEAGELKREIHTFKGNFLQKRFVHLPEVLHAVESALQEGDAQTPDMGKLEQALEEDLRVLRYELGLDFVDSYAVRIDKNRLRAIEKKAKILDETLYREIAALSDMELCEYMERFEKTVERVAEQEEKLVRFELACDTALRINYKENASLLSALTHLFSNAVAHGIETPDERLAAGKGEEGVVSCRVSETEDSVTIVVEDDGNGIDVAMIRQYFPGGGAPGFPGRIQRPNESGHVQRAGGRPQRVENGAG